MPCCSNGVPGKRETRQRGGGRDEHVSVLSLRFYILASNVLCGEDRSVFDPKLNTDNLSRCLQSLKELYADLRVKKVRATTFVH